MSTSKLTVETIILTRPELLATKDEGRYLPIRQATDGDNWNNELELYIPLLASVGMKYEIGGKESRGGLIVNAGEDCNPCKI